MPTIAANGVELRYETHGSPDDQSMLLISPLGGQLLMWEAEFVEALASSGFYVVRFDMRDSGLSTKMVDAPMPDAMAIMQGDFSSVTYSLSDLAADAAGLIGALQLGPCAVVGLSMGGMIAQTLAVEYPQVVRSLVSISACPSLQTVAFGKLLDERRDSSDKDIALEAWMESKRRQASPAFPSDEAALRERLREMIDLSWYPIGRARHMAAIAVSGDRTAALESIDVPTLVVHGNSDPLIDVSGGEATAKAIPGAQLMIIDGMAHDLPEVLWPQIINAIVELNQFSA